MFFKGHIERVKINICNLGKTKVIREIPQLAAHNLEIDWKKKKIEMTYYLPLYRVSLKIRKTKEKKIVERLVLRRF